MAHGTARNQSSRSDYVTNSDETEAFDPDEHFWDDSDSIVKPGECTFFSKAKSIARKAARAMVRTMIDYGPPYKPDFDVALINQCARPVLNHVELHNLLNTRLNPNLADPEDLYYTPMVQYIVYKGAFFIN
jgi:hypothetical protein